MSWYDSPPPEYVGAEKTAIKSTLAPKPYVVSLVHCEPGQYSKRDKLLTGKVLETINDAILVPELSLHMEVMLLLLCRAEKRFETRLDSVRDGFALVVKLKGKSTILMDEASWKAGKALLEKEEAATLHFMFASVPYGHKESQQAKARKPKQKGGGHCVVQ